VATDPELRDRIVAAVQQRGTVRARTINELKRTLQMDDFNGGPLSNAKFKRALYSLRYKYGRLYLSRPHMEGTMRNGYHIAPRG